ncbi:MAG: hypothetical protein S4CHLAM123_05120 [Chlamydiales bacterium]|nr:hypothetical protein [Chlamydiales bacterium]
MSNTISGCGSKRKFEEIDSGSDSNKIRKIEKSKDLEIRHYVFYNHFQHIAFYLSINNLLRFSQLNHFAYNELARRVQQLDPKATVLGPIAYHRRLLAGFSFLYAASSAFKNVWTTISATNSSTSDKNEGWLMLIRKIQCMSKTRFRDRIVKEIPRLKKNVPYQSLSKQDAVLRIQSVLPLHLLNINNKCGGCDNENPIFIACLLGDVEIVHYLLSQEGELNLTHSHPSIKTNLVLNSLPYIEIPQSKKESIINLLLGAGVNPYDKDDRNLTILEHAAYCGDSVLIQWLIRREVLPQTKNKGEDNVLHSLLKSAIKTKKNLEQLRAIFEILLKLDNVDPNLQGHNGWTPLHYAAKLGDQQILEMLYSSCSLDKDVQDQAGGTPLHAAIQISNVESQLEVIKLLLRKGENPNIKCGRRETVLYKHLVCLPGLWNEPAPRQQCRKELFDVLLAASTKASLGDVDNRRSWVNVVLASSISSEEKYYKIEALLKAGVDLNHLMPLASIIEKTGYKIARLLLEYGAVLSPIPMEMQRLLGDAIRKNDLASIKELISFGVDLNYSNSTGGTNLHSAVKFNSSKEIFASLLEAGVDPKLKDTEGKTALDLYMQKMKPRDDIMQLFADYTVNGVNLRAHK